MAGLTQKAAAEQLRIQGENTLAAEKKNPALRIFFGQFRDCMVMILLAATVISALLGELTDAVTILLIVLLNALLGFVQEYRTEKTLEALRGMTAPEAMVCRDDVWQRIPARLLVCGDLIRLEAGDQVPADAALQTASGLAVNESVLTGESEAVAKAADTPDTRSNALHQRGVVYSGTAVLRGTAQAVVIATGARTQVGQISSLLQTLEEPLTPLQKRLGHLGKVVALLCMAVCVVVFLAGVLRGEPLFAMLMTGITIAIAAIPEGLPATVTIALALAVSRMMKQKALVNRLHSVETLGCASVICSDKTGTITENRMTVTTVLAGTDRFSVESGSQPGSGGIVSGQGRAVQSVQSQPALYQLLVCGVLCSTAELSRHGNAWEVSGDPTETAVLVAAAKAGLFPEVLRRQMPVTDVEPFDSDCKQMTVTVRTAEGSMRYRKGAPDVLLRQCSHRFAHGGVCPMTAADLEQLRQQMSELSGRALRLLGFSYEVTAGQWIFLGIAGMQDPLRTSAKRAMHLCAQARIRTVMITGDHKETAVAIAQEANVPRGTFALTGAELDAMSDAELVRCVGDYGVFARVNPAHKLRLVRAYQAHGAVVAMTGDGVNDAPAIKAADVGVAMGRNGTDVARQAADVVLLDDNFATLVCAVEQGRCIYANIRKFVRYLLSCNIGEVVTMFAGILMGMPVVLLPTQLLLVNLVTDGLPAIALGMEPPDPELMHQPPRDPQEDFFSGGLLRRIVFHGIWIGLCTLGTFSAMLRMELPLEAARTAALCTLILSQLIHVFACKSETRGLFRIPYGNNWKLLAAAGFSLAVLVAAVELPALQVIFSTVSLGTTGWLTAVLGAVAVPVLSGLFLRRPGKNR